MKRIGSAFIALAVIFAAFSLYKKREADQQKKEAELNLGLEASKMINIAFEKKSQLIVAKISGDVVAISECKGRVFSPTQRTKAPVSINYIVSLERLDRSSYRWNATGKTLAVNVPEVRSENPNVDYTKQIVRQNGVFISRQCGLVLARQGALRISERARAVANDPKNLRKARDAARQAITAFAAGTLKAGGIPDINVRVVFPNEINSLRNDEHWDETKSLSQIFGNAVW